MSCLTDYIGLSGCGATSPASGLFINSLPGISLKSVESLADGEQKTFIGVWDDVQVRAIKRLELMLNAALSKDYKVKSALYSVNIQPSTYTGLSGAFTLPAFKFEKGCNSSLSYHHFESITFKSVSLPATGTFSFYDAETLELLATSSKAATGTETTIQLNLDIYRPEVYMVYQSSNGLYYMDEFESIYNGGTIIKSGTYSAGTFTQNNYCYGLKINYGVRCSLTNILCHSKDLFAYPLWYLAGSELMMERMVSDRINKYTIDRKQAEELKAYYDAEAEKALHQAIAGTSISDCDCCIQCDPTYGVREAVL